MTTATSPRTVRHRRVVVFCLVGLALAGMSSAAADPNPAATKKIDWAAIDGALAAGAYAEAAAAADEMAKTIEPRKRDADFLPRSIDLIRLLMRRGVGELRLGRLDAADATFEEAIDLLKDDDFGRLVALASRGRNPQSAAAGVLLDVNLVELLDLRMAVVLERLRLLRLGVGEQPTGAAADPSAQAERWSRQLDLVGRMAEKAREDLAERFEEGGPAVLNSPYYRSLPGRFRPTLVAGIKNLEFGALATGEPRAAAAAEAQRLFAEAAAELERVLAAAAPQGTVAPKPEARREAALLRADLLTSEGTALLEAGEPAAARKRFAAAIDLRREAGQAAKIPRPDAHPDLFVPLLLSATALLDESRAMFASGDVSRARDLLLEASQNLARAEALPFPKEHPLQDWRTNVGLRLEDDLAALEGSIAGRDAADAAVRRLRRAVDATAPTAAGVAP